MLVHLRCSIFPDFFFSTQFKQYQSQQISARYGRFNYNTPEYVEKGHFLTNKCCNQPRVSCHVECCNRPFRHVKRFVEREQKWVGSIRSVKWKYRLVKRQYLFLKNVEFVFYSFNKLHHRSPFVERPRTLILKFTEMQAGPSPLLSTCPFQSFLLPGADSAWLL